MPPCPRVPSSGVSPSLHSPCSCPITVSPTLGTRAQPTGALAPGRGVPSPLAAPCPPGGLWDGEGPCSPLSAPPCPPEPAQVQSGAADLSGGGPAAPLLHRLLSPLGPPDSPDPPEGGQPPTAGCLPMPAPLNCSPPPQYLLGSAPAARGWHNPSGPPSPGGWMRGLGLPPGTQDSPGGRGLPKGMGTPRIWGHRAGGGAGPSGTKHRDLRGEHNPHSPLPPSP